MRRPILQLTLLTLAVTASTASAHSRRKAHRHDVPRPHLVMPFGFAVALPHLAFGLAVGAAAPVYAYEAPPLVEVEVEEAPEPPPLVEVEVLPPPPPPVVVQVAPRPPPQVRAPPPPAEEEEPAPERPPRVAVKWAPLARSMMSLDSLSGRLFEPNAGSVGLEYRFSRYWALRTDLQYSRDGALWDVAAAKFSLFPNSFFRPFASGGVSGIRLVELGTGTRVDSTRLGVVASAGLNLFFGKHVFLEAEGKFRHYLDDPFNDMAVRNLSQWTVLIGGGVAFL